MDCRLVPSSERGETDDNKGFDSAGISEAVQNALQFYEKVENPFKD